jgi:hypothetical protein
MPLSQRTSTTVSTTRARRSPAVALLIRHEHSVFPHLWDSIQAAVRFANASPSRRSIARHPAGTRRVLDVRPLRIVLMCSPQPGLPRCPIQAIRPESCANAQILYWLVNSVRIRAGEPPLVVRRVDVAVLGPARTRPPAMEAVISSSAGMRRRALTEV